MQVHMVIFNFGNSRVFAAGETINGDTTLIPLMKINALFNGHAIWWPDDDWNTQFKNNMPSNSHDNGQPGYGKSDDEYKEYNHGIDGYGAFYSNVPDRNDDQGGLPADGILNIGDVPFIFQQNSNGTDCIRLSKDNSSTSFCFPDRHYSTTTSTSTIYEEGFLGYDAKYKNLYVTGLVGGDVNNSNVNYHFNAYDLRSDSNRRKLLYETTNSSNPRHFLDYFSSTTNLNNDKQTTGGIYNYTQNYGIRQLTRDTLYRPNDLQSDPPNIQCSKVSVSDNKKIQDLKISLTNPNSLSNNQYLCIFGITAEIATDLQATDITSDSFLVSYKNSSQKIKKLELCEMYPDFDTNDTTIKQIDKTYSGSNIENTKSIVYCRPNTIYYVRTTDESGYMSYLRVKTVGNEENKRTANFKITGKNRIFNGQDQLLITEAELLDDWSDLGLDAIENLLETNIFRLNVYLKLTNSSVDDGSETYSTGWWNINNLDKLKAKNAGTYYLYYYVNKNNDILQYYDFPSENVTFTIS